ncbi:hypothetical protein [Clostridium perfringens]|uniref:hypothetical protein n=1 Tax=Clostridium perfringens TaxID=1502 RepID=UPI003F41DB62
MAEKKTKDNRIQGCKIGPLDLKIFKVINKYGCVKKSLFSLIENRKEEDFQKTYIRQRLKKLHENKYIKSVGQSYLLDKKGEYELNLNGIELNYKSTPKGIEKIKKAYKDAALIMNMDFKYKLSRIETILEEEKQGHEVSMIKNYSGTVWDEENKKYLVYRISKLRIFQLVKDIGLDVKYSGIKRIIIATDNISQMIEIKEKVKKLEVKEFLVIPNSTEGLKILSQYRQGFLSNKNIFNYIKNSNKNLDIKLEKNNIIFNDLLTENLTILDLKKEQKFKQLAYLKRASSAMIICSEIYSQYYKENSIFELTKKEIESGKEEIEQNLIRINFEKFNNFINKKES